MKRSLVMALGCAIVLAGCGNAATAPATTEQPATEASSEAPAAEASSEASTEASAEQTEGDIFAEMDLGEELTPDENGVVSNGFISITMPADSKGTYLAYSYEDDINIYDKESSEAGYGGFIFGVCTSEGYGQYGGMRTKIGELTESDGKVYDVLCFGPSDVQWDYTKGEEMPAAYKALYDNSREIAATVQSVNGGTYVDGAGTKGEEIYGEVVKDIITKIENAKSSDDLEKENLSAVYYAVTQGAEAKDPLKVIGVAYADFNLDGVDEMLIGEVDNGQIYDVYACVAGKPEHVTSGHWRDYYKVYGSFLAEYLLEGDGIQTINTYDLGPSSVELFPQYSIKLDESEGAENKWSVSYDEGETWEALTEEDYKQYLSNIEYTENDKALKFVPIGELK